MKKFKLIISVMGCLVTTPWGADLTEVIEGGVGEAESSVSFLRNEMRSGIEKAESALASVKAHSNNHNHSLAEQYQITQALEALVKAAHELIEVNHSLDVSEANANFIRAQLEAKRSEENDE